jgi:DNA repair protein RecO (recombination protein O)
MAGRGETVDAWLLHSRPFRDTSLLVDFLTREHGRISAVARGARTQKGRGRSTLQPFVPLRVTLAGKHELRTLQSAEAAAAGVILHAERLIAGFYLNELLVKLLHGHEPEPRVFEAYSSSLASLAMAADVEPLLREFELCLLDSLGYGLQFDHDAETGEPLQEQGWYYLQSDSGFVRQLEAPVGELAAAQSGLFPGWALLQIGSGDFAAESTRKYAKRLLRQALQQHLGDKVITSRQLFAKP